MILISFTYDLLFRKKGFKLSTNTGFAAIFKFRSKRLSSKQKEF
jgi:hypothetical protein